MGPMVLITGANGFIGSYTTLLFESLNHRVLPLDIAPRSDDLSLLPVKTSTTMMDIADSDGFGQLCRQNGVTHIIHTAYPQRREEPDILNFYLQSMRNILEMAREMKMQRVVFSSSGAVYGPLRKKDGALIKEDDPVSIYPTFIYRSAKILGEWLGDFYALHHDVSFIALRFSSVYGPGQAKGLGAEIKKGILGQECRPYLTRMPDDLIFVKDVAQAVNLACFCNDPKSRAYNIASEKSYGEDDLERAMHKHLPGLSFTIGRHPDAATTNIFRQRDNLDVTLARRELGFSPEFDLDRGIGTIADWAKHNF